MKRLLSALALMLALVSLVAPSGASAQIGCQVVRAGSYHTPTVEAGGTGTMIWAYLVENQCGWLLNGTGTSSWPFITIPLGANRCYNGQVIFTYANNTYNKSFVITAWVVKQREDAPGGWETLGAAMTDVAPRGQAGAFVPVTVPMAPFVGSANNLDKIGVAWQVNSVNPSGLVNFRIYFQDFRVKEIDCLIG